MSDDLFEYAEGDRVKFLSKDKMQEVNKDWLDRIKRICDNDPDMQDWMKKRFYTDYYDNWHLKDDMIDKFANKYVIIEGLNLNLYSDPAYFFHLETGDKNCGRRVLSDYFESLKKEIENVKEKEKSNIVIQAET